MRTALVCVLLSLGCTVAEAATVSVNQGTVQVNRGTGFRTINGPVLANTGVTVIAQPGGQGVISYDDGCDVIVNPGAVYRVGAQSPCQAGLPPATADFLATAAIIYTPVIVGTVLSASP